MGKQQTASVAKEQLASVRAHFKSDEELHTLTEMRTEPCGIQHIRNHLVQNQRVRKGQIAFNLKPGVNSQLTVHSGLIHIDITS